MAVKYQSKTLDKTNLMIFLTPHILKEPSQFVELQRQKAAKMDEFIENNKMEKPVRSRQEIVGGQSQPSQP